MNNLDNSSNMEMEPNETDNSLRIVAEMENVFSKEDLDFFDENGYVILHNAITEEQRQATVATIWNFLGMNPNDPRDWYRAPALRNGFVELYHHQTFWDNRCSPRIYKAFTELYGTHDLWVSIDRACMKVPARPNDSYWNHKGFVHWDLDPWADEYPFQLQAVLCLEDTEENQGGFHCVPGMHKYLKQWIKQFKPPKTAIEKYYRDRFPINVPESAMKKIKVQKIPAKAGDLIIWRRELVHGNGENTSTRPRLAQYINMYPVGDRYDTTRILTTQESLHPEPLHQRIEMWRHSLSPFHKPGDKRKIEKEQRPAVLNEVGKRLLGLERW